MNTTTTIRTRLRSGIVGGVFLFCLLGVTAQAVRLQVFDGPWLSERAIRQVERAVVIQGKRGAITDRNGSPLAVSIDNPSIVAYPRQVSDREGAARQLAGALSQPYREIYRQLNPQRTFVWLQRQATPRQAEAVQALGIAGVGILTEHSRYYPNKSLAAQLVGFTGTDGHGLEGVEFFFDGQLKGGEQAITILRDALGRRFEGAGLPPEPTGGSTVVLTLDSTIQHIVQKALEASVTTHGAASGLAVVVAPATGEVLALANYPYFNPNRYQAAERGLWRNRAITDPFEPGSTLKLFSAAAALDSGSSTPSSTYFCENGKFRVGRNLINDTKPHGWLSLQQIVQVSSNIGSVKIAQQMGAAQLHHYLEAFGFGRRSGLPCPGETAGSLSSFQSWTPIDMAAISFGQGISVSAIQLAMATAAIANDGILMKPQLVKAILDGKGNVVQQFSPEPVRRVISATTAAAMRQIMKTVTTEGGTGVNAALAGYTVGGKTGTAQKVDSGGGYAKNRYLSSFLGIAPADRPELVILVIVDEPKRMSYGGIVAAPAFRQIALETLTYLNIPPGPDTDRLQVSRANGAEG